MGNPITQFEALGKIVSARFLRSSMPDFLGIGALKAGTSWSYENLKQHPDIYLSDQKELHYFDKKLNDSLLSYSRNFKNGKGKVKGEITPAYSILTVEKIRLIKKLMPKVKLILLIRNPIERAWSHAIMDLVARPNKTFEEVPEEAFLSHFKSDYAIKRGDYSTVLENWLSVFSSEQLYLGLFTDIVDSPKQLLLEIFSHLGVSSDIYWDTLPYNTIIHRNPEIIIPQKYRAILESIYSPKIERLANQYNIQL
ncbi:MAG: sulfotransferase [Mariniphaga sp.]